eukprot:TRINITY_DN5181_c0_g1_i1.p1 TRINITY_DN5181_c0_g1~~TRINITY_DN5181_c0_g1_i1.p1  ORF type:complete len:418 (-),score=83.74 TRINITY_DN5181_c0_g1_i1:172-1425(-)
MVLIMIFEIVCRDIKFSNVVLDSGSGYAALNDFGTSCSLRYDGMTQLEGEQVGTVFWSPDEFMERKAYLGSDVYSFGLLVYRLAGLTDRSPDSDMLDNKSNIASDILDLCQRCTGPPGTRPTAEQLIHDPVFAGIDPTQTFHLLAPFRDGIEGEYLRSGDKVLNWDPLRQFLINRSVQNAQHTNAARSLDQQQALLFPQAQHQQQQPQQQHQQPQEQQHWYQQQQHPAGFGLPLFPPALPASPAVAGTIFQPHSSQLVGESPDDGGQNLLPGPQSDFEKQKDLIARDPWLLDVNTLVSLVIHAKMQSYEMMAHITGKTVEYWRRRHVDDPLADCSPSNTLQFDEKNSALRGIVAAVVEFEESCLRQRRPATPVKRDDLEKRTHHSSANNHKNKTAVLKIMRTYGLTVHSAANLLEGD